MFRTCSSTSPRSSRPPGARWWIRTPEERVAIVDDEGVRYSGRGSDPNARRLTPDTPIRIGGIGAIFAELTTLAPVDGDGLALDERIADFLDGTRLPESLTVGDLVTHSGGIPDYVMSIESTKRLMDVAGVMWTPPRPSTSWRTARSDTSMGFGPSSRSSTSGS